MRAGGFVFDYRPDTLRNLCLVLSRRVACADQPRGRGAGERATTLLILDLCLKSRHVPVFLDPSLLAAPFELLRVRSMSLSSKVWVGGVLTSVMEGEKATATHRLSI